MGENKNMREGYVKPGKHASENTWYNLDNAANLFPAISNNRNTNVFRLSCDLVENIDKDILQNAVDKALSFFPYFRVIMRRGLFWNYLERTDLAPEVRHEDSRPCSSLFYRNVKQLLFEVTYFGRRINLEVFHSVSDGSGAMELLRTIVREYILIAHRDDFPESLPSSWSGAPPSHMAEDSFDHHYNPKDRQSPFRKKAYNISGTLLPFNSVKVISVEIPTSKMLSLAKSNGVTVTAYLTALMICSIYDGLVPRRAAGRTVGVNIPVDLRGHFKSESARNFFSVIEISYNFGGDPADFGEVLKSVSAQLSERLKPDSLARRFNYSMSVQKNILTGITPLFLKHLILGAAYHRGEAATTCALSNLGRILMPEAFVPFISGFHCLLNPTSQHRLKAALCSFGDRFVINFTSCIAETKAQKSFIRRLAAEGLDVTVTCNGGYGDETV